MFYYTYKITNNVNGHFYIGVHKTKNLEDGYMGSGTVIKRAIAKYGIQNFTKEILKFHESQEEMYLHEEEIVDADLVLRKDSYNIKLGGRGGFDYVNATNSKEYIHQRNIRASAIMQEKLKDPNFYSQWHSRMIEGRLRAKLAREKSYNKGQ